MAKLQEALKGRIMGCHVNNLRIGFAPAERKILSAPRRLEKAATAVVTPSTAGDTTAALYLAQRNRLATPDTGYTELSFPLPIVPSPTFFSSPYEGNIVNIAGPGGIYVGKSLIDFLVEVAEADSNSHITNISGDTTGAGWLEGFKFHDVDFYTDETDSGFDPVTGEGFWEGWNWMYIIGSPTSHSIPYSNYGFEAQYPDLGLAQFALGGVPLTDGTHRNFTFSYEHVRVEFSVFSSDDSGESVHKVLAKAIKRI